MRVAYLLLFLIHLSASACEATSRNHRLFLPGAAGGVPGHSPAIHDHRHGAKGYLSSYYDVHYYPAMTARRGGPPPRPSPAGGVVTSAVVESAPPPSSLSGVEASSVGGGGAPPPPGDEANAATEPSPHDSGGGEGGASSESTGMDDVGVDYEGPKTHPPSHN